MGIETDSTQIQCSGTESTLIRASMGVIPQTDKPSKYYDRYSILTIVKIFIQSIILCKQ